MEHHQLQKYSESGESNKRQGGYNLQKLGSTLIERIEGDVNNVLGFPIPNFCILLRQLLEEVKVMEKEKAEQEKQLRI